MTYKSKFKIVKRSEPTKILIDTLDSRFYTMPWLIALDASEGYLALVRDARRPPIDKRPIMAIDLTTFAFGFFKEIEAYDCLLEPQFGRFKPVQARSPGKTVVNDEYDNLVLDAVSLKMHPSSEVPRLTELMFEDIGA